MSPLIGFIHGSLNPLSYEVRLAKYAMRGFEVHVPNLVRKDIDPTIFERSINRIEGLARLLVLEKLADPVDRTKYLERRREIRGRPQTHGYSRRAMRRRRKLVKGDFKAVDQLFGGLSASDYGTQSFHIPYGPGFDAKKLERVIYKMDLGTICRLWERMLCSYESRYELDVQSQEPRPSPASPSCLLWYDGRSPRGLLRGMSR